MRHQQNLTRRCSFEALEPRRLLSGTGLVAQYFHNPDFTGLAYTRHEAVAHDWGTESPAPGVDGDTFSVRWTGQIKPEFSETYVFRLLSDEAARLWVDGQLLVDDWSPHSARIRSGMIELQADQLYDIRVEYREFSGNARIELSWFSPSRPSQVVPLDRLYESPHGLLGAYQDDAGGALERVDPLVDFDWNTAAPDPQLGANHFHVAWTGQLRPDYSDLYTFSTISDDGVRVWIGGELVIDNWTDHPPTEDSGTKMLEAGKWYDVRIEYYENAGGAEIEWRWSSERQTAGNAEVVPQTHLRATKRNAVTYQNALGNGEDPYVTQWNGQYLMTRSQFSGGQWGVWINRADSLEDIHASNPDSESIKVWSPPPGTNYSGEVWAPELHRLGNNWYIYVAASDGNNVNHRMHVLERLGPDPFGPYTYKGQLAADTDRWAIDGTVLEWENQLYFVWSGWPAFTDGLQNLYIAKMRNPWTLLGDRVMISTPQHAWEKHGLSINEGPQILKHDDQLHIVYSASGFWTPNYALGRLTYDGVGSLLDPASWSKSPVPVFRRSGGVVGVGHASFTKSPDGSENWIVYHSHANPNGFTHRLINIKPFEFTADGMPDFGAPMPYGQSHPVPSVGPDPEREFVAGDFNADGLVDARDHDTWRASFGAEVFPGTSADANGDGVVGAADYIAWRRASAMSAAATSVSVAEPQPPLDPIDSPAQAAEIPSVQPPADADEPLVMEPVPESRPSRTGHPRTLLRAEQTAIAIQDAALASWSQFLDERPETDPTGFPARTARRHDWQPDASTLLSDALDVALLAW